MDIENIYEQYYRDVYQFALYFTNSKQEAEDITQETFIKVMKNYDSLRDFGKLKTWIISIARNTAIDLQRKKRWTRYLSNWNTQEMIEEHTPEKAALRNGDWLEVQSALLKLKPHYRTIIILRGLKELSIQETAAILGCREQKVRVDFHRAMQQLKKNMKSDDEGWGLTNEHS